MSVSHYLLKILKTPTDIIAQIGAYTVFMQNVFKKPQKGGVFFSQFLTEVFKLGINSIWIVLIISFFMGAVIALQTGYNMGNPLLPDYLIGFATRESMLLEFSSTIVSLILAGKVGSNIASELGTMRVTEQIDALDIMGINSANFLVMPKVMASMFINPFLYVLSALVGISGGLIAATTAELCNTQDFIQGLRLDFKPFYLFYSITKMIFFAFIIVSVSSFYGYFVKGGALDVGKASTKSVVNSSILILLFNLILTQLLLK